MFALARRYFVKIALTAALGALLEVAEPLFKKVAEALGQAASALGDTVLWALISALEELASLATNLARKAEEAEVPEVAEVAKRIAREANEMARKLRNLKAHDVASRGVLRKEAQSMNFGMVPKVPSQENMFGPTHRVALGARGVPRLSSHANMCGGTYMAQGGIGGNSSHENFCGGTYMAHEGVIGVPRVSSNTNMCAGTYMAEPGAGKTDSAIREIESQARQVEEAARKLKAKVVDTTIPGQKGGKINGKA